jgi:hypothetical protein
MRQQFGADLAHLIYYQANTDDIAIECGGAFVGDWIGHTNARCAKYRYSFPHELGHCLGVSGHDGYDNTVDITPAETYRPFCTVMERGCDVPRIPAFTADGGIYMGTPFCETDGTCSDNAGIISGNVLGASQNMPKMVKHTPSHLKFSGFVFLLVGVTAFFVHKRRIGVSTRPLLDIHSGDTLDFGPSN